MNTDVLKELVALSEKATPGPWEVFVDGGLPLKVIAPDVKDWHGDICKVSVRPEIYGDGAWDADFIVAARNAIPALKSLLSQEAELENLANRMGTAATVNGHDEHAQEVLRAFRDELRALIRRHHES